MSISRRTFTSAVLGSSALLALGRHDAFAAKIPLLKREIPSTGEAIPIIGIGTNRFGVGADPDFQAPLREALGMFHELGGTVIDTAPGYRSSESVLGGLISELNIKSDIFVATKVDTEGSDASAARMQGSVNRLNPASIDLMQVHNFVGWEDALPVMQEWKEDGRIRYVGVTTSRKSQYELMEKVMLQFDLDFIQINYSLANQRDADKRIIPLAKDRGTAVMVNRPFGGGAAFRMLSKADIPEWAFELGILSWAQFLLKYVLSHPAVTCAIPGMTKERHVVDNLAAAQGALPSASQREQMEIFFNQL